MAGRLERSDCAAAIWMVTPNGRSRTRLRRANFGLQHQWDILIDDPGPIERGQPQNCGCGITTVTADQRCIPQLRPVQFRQAVYCLVEQVGRWVSMAVPALVKRRGAQTKVR